MKSPNKMDLAYIAGFFDGEGSVYVTGKHHNIRVGISNTNPLIPQLACRLFGGSVHWNKSNSSKMFKKRPTNHRLCLQWNINGSKACDFLKAIRPFLKMKIEQANIAITLQKTKQKKVGGVIIPLSYALIAWREKQKQKINTLNGRKLI
jgi:hypothetical protein